MIVCMSALFDMTLDVSSHSCVYLQLDIQPTQHVMIWQDV